MLHFWYNVTIANDDAAKSHEFVDVLRSQLTDAICSLEVVGSDLDKDIVHLLVVSHVLLTSKVVHVEFLEDLSHNEIENRNDVRRVVFNLAVKLRVIRKNVGTVYIKHLHFHVSNFLKLLDVKWNPCKLIIAAILVYVFCFHEVVNELFKLLLHQVCLNVSSPEHLCM